MTVYKLQLLAEDGTVVSERKMPIHRDELVAASWLFATKAEELFRDATYREGWFDEYMRSPGRRNFWTHR